jgi:hypothetical protein
MHVEFLQRSKSDRYSPGNIDADGLHKSSRSITKAR